MTLADLLRRTRHVLLDFDGPVCSVYGGASDRAVADHLRRLLESAGTAPPPNIQTTCDPLDVLRYAAQVEGEIMRRVEVEFVRQEVAAVETAVATPGAREALSALKFGGRSITIVSNNSKQAIYSYLRREGLEGLISGVIGRIPGRPDLMKPHGKLLYDAINSRPADAQNCVMIGDSATDVEAAHLVAVPVIAFANKHYKRAIFEGLTVDQVIYSMAELAEAASPPSSLHE